MSKSSKQRNDYNKPVAYDTSGQPLYAHPPDKGTKMVDDSHGSDDATKPRQKEPKKIFSGIELCDDEALVLSIKRHPVGIVGPFLVGILLATSVFLVAFNLNVVFSALGIDVNGVNYLFVALLVIFLILLIIITTYTTYFIYINNRLFLTNKSIYQTVQIGLFSKYEQTISLDNIEDASYTQTGILQQILEYGSIRLSTIGDEHTYSLTYVSHPKVQINILNKAISAYKSDRKGAKN